MIILSFVLLSQVFIPVAVKSQDFVSVDLKTYNLYLERKWDELIRLGKEGLKKGFDYYYLRMRIGIAHYEKRNYKTAQAHFRKALEFNDGDPVASEYLYYACLFAGQWQQAGLLAKQFTLSLAEEINPVPLKFTDMLSVEYLYNFNDTEHILSDPENYFSGLPYGYQLVTLDFSNLNAMLHHHISPGITLTHAYTRLNKTNYYYYDDGLSRFGVDEQKVVQNQYYISPAFSTRSGLNISPAFHYLRIKYQVPYVVTGGGSPGFGGGTNSYIRYTDLVASDFVGGLNLSQYAGRFTIRLGGIYSSINDASQLTGTGGLTWYPMGNLDLYMNANLNSHIEFKDNETSVELIPDFLIGFGISSKVWMEFSGAWGNMKNYTEGNGYIVYNGLDWMKYKVIGSIVIPITKKGSKVYLGGRFAEYESRFIPFDPQGADDLNIIINNSISIYGGLSWKF
jgi:tetratricopeptide (TPR) repeat protein